MYQDYLSYNRGVWLSLEPLRSRLLVEKWYASEHLNRRVQFPCYEGSRCLRKTMWAGNCKTCYPALNILQQGPRIVLIVHQILRFSYFSLFTLHKTCFNLEVPHVLSYKIRVPVSNFSKWMCQIFKRKYKSVRCAFFILKFLSCIWNLSCIINYNDTRKQDPSLHTVVMYSKLIINKNNFMLNDYISVGVRFRRIHSLRKHYII